MESPMNIGCLALLVSVPLTLLAGVVLVMTQWRLWSLPVDSPQLATVIGYRNLSGGIFCLGLLGLLASIWLYRRGLIVDNQISSGGGGAL